MPTFVMRGGKLVEKQYAEPLNRAAYVISDSMPELRHMGTGKKTDSKSEFRKMTKASGCVELGNEPIRSRAPIVLDRGQRRDDIRKAIYQLRNGHG